MERRAIWGICKYRFYQNIGGRLRVSRLCARLAAGARAGVSQTLYPRYYEKYGMRKFGTCKVVFVILIQCRLVFSNPVVTSLLQLVFYRLFSSIQSLQFPIRIYPPSPRMLHSNSNPTEIPSIDRSIDQKKNKERTGFQKWDMGNKSVLLTPHILF